MTIQSLEGVSGSIHQKVLLANGVGHVLEHNPKLIDKYAEGAALYEQISKRHGIWAGDDVFFTPMHWLSMPGILSGVMTVPYDYFDGLMGRELTVKEAEALVTYSLCQVPNPYTHVFSFRSRYTQQHGPATQHIASALDNIFPHDKGLAFPFIMQFHGPVKISDPDISSEDIIDPYALETWVPSLNEIRSSYRIGKFCGAAENALVQELDEVLELGRGVFGRGAQIGLLTPDYPGQPEQLLCIAVPISRYLEIGVRSISLADYLHKTGKAAGGRAALDREMKIRRVGNITEVTSFPYVLAESDLVRPVPIDTAFVVYSSLNSPSSRITVIPTRSDQSIVRSKVIQHFGSTHLDGELWDGLTPLPIRWELKVDNDMRDILSRQKKGKAAYVAVFPYRKRRQNV